MPETPRSDGDAYADAYDDEEEIAAEKSSSRPSDPPTRTAKKDVGNSDDDAEGGENDDDDDDDANELAEMFAKVQTIQKAEGIKVKPVVVKPPPSRGEQFDKLEVVIPDQATAKRSSGATPKSSVASSTSSRSRTSSPAGSNVAITRSPDGITTLSRKAVTRGQATTSFDILSGVKKPELFQTRLLQTAKQQPKALEQMKQKVVAAAPATIAKRIESLSEPKKSDSGRKFATDDEEKHCRFRTKKKNKDSGGRDVFEDDDGGSNRNSDFIARMEAAERNRQKKLELTRGEKEYLANLNKKICPKCDVPQSYSEYRDKKKRCQMCGSEFRVPQAWGDVGSEFISRISEDVRVRDERKELIKAQVVHAETASGRVSKSATQQYYEKALQQRNEHKTFLDRNYSATASASMTGTASSSSSKTKQAQAQLQMQLQAQRAKLLAAAQPPIY